MCRDQNNCFLVIAHHPHGRSVDLVTNSNNLQPLGGSRTREMSLGCSGRRLDQTSNEIL